MSSSRAIPDIMPFKVRSNMLDSMIELACPSPRRYVQRLVRQHALKDGADIGCGENSLLTPLRAHGFRTIGIDGSEEMLASARARGLHDEYILSEFRKCELDRQFDVVVMSHVIEHFTRDEAWEVLRRVESLARRMVYVETPRGFFEQPALQGNPYQRHFSGWFPHDFECRGYSVFGMGLRGLQYSWFGSNALWRMAVNWTNRLTRRFVYRRPWMATTIGAIRFIDREGNWLKV
jgi:SAM-dependent methyltransferase